MPHFMLAIFQENMAEAREPLEELDFDMIDQLASIPNIDNMTTCSCRGNCLRERGRNFCPCRSISQFCSSACHDEFLPRCFNDRRAQESSSDETTVSILFIFRNYFDLMSINLSETPVNRYL
jgi:hypothetical protein